jgi:hypothetical protein
VCARARACVRACVWFVCVCVCARARVVRVYTHTHTHRERERERERERGTDTGKDRDKDTDTPRQQCSPRAAHFRCRAYGVGFWVLGFGFRVLFAIVSS